MSSPDAFPRGTVVFLFTDIEGSTALWEQQRMAMRAGVDCHIELLGQAIADHRGVHFKTVGDALRAGFHTAPEALAAAIAGQRLIDHEAWPPEIGVLRIRMALHTGVAHPDRVTTSRPPSTAWPGCSTLGAEARFSFPTPSARSLPATCLPLSCCARSGLMPCVI